MRTKRPETFVYQSNNPNQEVKSIDIAELINDHIEPEKWLEHADEDLMKYWLTDDAKTFTHDLYSTYRDIKGKHVNPEKLTPEFKAALANPETAGLVDLEHNYIRAHSRQTFGYGIAYNMTGKFKYLELCKKGVNALMRAFDKNKGMYTQQAVADGRWGQDPQARTSQDLAYGISGMGMYYYLTHDAAVLEKILEAKNYIFDTYFDDGRGIFTWNPKYLEEKYMEIVAQLDQIYGYMIWLTPTLPEPYQSEWRADLKKITDILIYRFYSERYGFFWGRNTEYSVKRPGTAHTDFGHSIKTMWLIFEVGAQLGEMSYVTFARKNISKLLDTAYMTNDDGEGTWARRFDEKGVIETRMKEWWALAELNQACAILAINDPSYLEMLNNTYDYWFKYMVDYENGEIWHMFDDKTKKPVLCYPKIHSWKNCFHSMEHALFGYITSSQIKDKNFRLYYAFENIDEASGGKVAPYLFRANIVQVRELSNENSRKNTELANNKIIEVMFNSLH